METKKEKLTYSMEIPRQPKYVVLIREFLEQVMSMEKVKPAEMDDIILAVSESCDKLMSAKGKDSKKMKIMMGVKIAARKVTVKLVNKERGLEKEKFSDVDEHQVVLDTLRGRISDYLIRKSIDEISFSSSKKKGTSIKIIKFRGKK